MSEKDIFVLSNEIKYIENKLGKEEWLTLYKNEIDMNKGFQDGIFTAILRPGYIKEIMKKYGWDILIGSGRPGYNVHYKNGKEIIEYYRFSHKELEPLVIYRHFHGIKEIYLEVSEELRLFLNLYEKIIDLHNRIYIAIDDNGDEDEVIIIKGREVKIKLRYLKEYLSARNMALVIYFEYMRFSEKTLSELGLIEEQNDYGDKTNLLFNHLIRLINIDKFESQSWLLGKKIITGIKDYKPDVWGNENKEYTEFIIGLDEDGKEKFYTCDEEKLANFFGKNPGSPNYLTPIFFKKDVLTKYYYNSEKYSVDDGYVTCGGVWSLRIDNNHMKYVVAFLGDLGHLSYKEQLYWKSFNVCHSGGISSVAWKRSFKGEFTDPEEPSLYFKMKYEEFNDKWNKKFGWYFFKPLVKDDFHHYKTLHVPLNNDRKEFDEQVLSLNKIIIDSLNETKISEGIEFDKQSPKGIDKLEGLLKSKGLKIGGMIEFLRNLYSLRSTSIAHRKSENNKDYQKVQKYFSIGSRELDEVFTEILIKSVQTFSTLEHYFLAD